MDDLERFRLSLAPASPTSGERRGAPRHRTLLGGKLVHTNGLLSMDCVLRNMSETGARISLPPNTAVPDHFDLIDLKHGEAFACRVVWHDYPLIGVTFESRESLEQPDTPRLKSLKRLWLDALNTG